MPEAPPFTPTAKNEGDKVTAPDWNALNSAIAEALAIASEQPPTITDPASQTGSVGTPLELVIVASNATSFSASGLPAGLQIDPKSGRIFGTPTTAETTAVIVTASSGLGSALAPFSFTISAAAAPTVTKPANQTGQVSVPVTPLSIEATNTSLYEASGLPPGVSINAGTGRITGTPTSNSGSPYTVTITVKNAVGASKATTFTFTIEAAPSAFPVIRTGTDPEGTNVAEGTTVKAPEPVAGTLVGDRILMYVNAEAVGGSAVTITTPTGWTVVAHGEESKNSYYLFSRIYDGSPMPTLTASAPVKAGEYNVRLLSFANGEALDVTASVFAHASEAEAEIPSVTTTSANELVLALLYNPAGRSWTATAGMTAAGWTDPGPYIAKTRGRPFVKQQTAAGATAVVKVKPSSATTYSVIVTSIKPKAAVSTIGAKLSTDKLSIEPEGLPAGTAFIATALCTAESGHDEETIAGNVAASTTNIFGTPSHPWVAIEAQDSGHAALGVYTARIKTTPALSAPVVTKPPTQAGQIGKAFSYQVVASESPTSYTASPLPKGLSINSSGVISGTPTTEESVTVTVTATNATGTSPAVTFTFGVSKATTTLVTGVVNNAGDHGSVSATVIGYGAAIVRDEFGIATAASTVVAASEYYASKGAKLQPIAGAQARIPSAAEAKGLASWASALAAKGLYNTIEFENETNYQIPGNKANGELYGARAKEAADAILATGTNGHLLVQGSDGGFNGTYGTEWLDGILTAWPKAWEHAAFAGWVIHSYPGSKVFGEKDTFGVPMMERMRKRLEEKGDTASSFYVTEWGIPSTAAGTTMSSGQSLDWSEAAKVLEAHIPLLQAAAKNRIAQILLYQAHDQSPEGETNREKYFGAVTSSGAAKGAFTTFAKAFL